MDWFEQLTGFYEQSPEQVRQNLTIENQRLTSKRNGKTWVYGTLETPTLGELRDRLKSIVLPTGRLTIREVVADVQDLHRNIENSGALFQVASQFNLLEMVSPTVTPEAGVGIYENDRTQGPACAIAAGAGTIYRHYFAPVQGQMGQSMQYQINCLADLGQALGNDGDRLWTMQNGYVFPSAEGLAEIDQQLRQANEAELDRLRQRLRIGLQWNTQVTLQDCSHLVSQAYCSALPIGYSQYSPDRWERFAKLVLEASYEATLIAGIINQMETGNPTVFLTLIGGGVFGNPMDWIVQAIERAAEQYRSLALDIAIVSYGRSKPELQSLLTHSF